MAAEQVRGVLVGIAGELKGELLPIHVGDNQMGRSNDCRLVLRSVKISRAHATVVCEEDFFAVAPLSETNPLYLNGEATEGGELKDGDVLQLGDSVFRFRSIAGV